MISLYSLSRFELGLPGNWGVGAQAVFSRSVFDQGWTRGLDFEAGENRSTDIMTINRPDDFGDIADLGLTSVEEKLLLAGLQQKIVAAQARGHAVRRPGCRRWGLFCWLKDYRNHRVATFFGQVTVRLLIVEAAKKVSQPDS